MTLYCNRTTVLPYYYKCSSHRKELPKAAKGGTIFPNDQAFTDIWAVKWNGLMGMFETEAFAKGTNAVATTLAELTGKDCITIIGSGDSVAAVEKSGLADKTSTSP